MNISTKMYKIITNQIVCFSEKYKLGQRKYHTLELMTAFHALSQHHTYRQMKQNHEQFT